MRRMTANAKRPSGWLASAGFSLIEVMIALLVLTIGVLGMARLILVSKQLNYEAVQRSIAITLAQDMLERIRSNPRALAQYNNKTVGSGTATSQACSTACTGTQLALYDVYQWDQALYGAAETSGGAVMGGLVTPSGCITVNGNVVTVQIAWLGSRDTTVPNSNCGSGIGSRRQLISVQSYVTFM